MSGEDRAAVLIPGSRPCSTLLEFASAAVSRRGAYEHRHQWPRERPAGPDGLAFPAAFHAWADAQVAAAIDATVAAPCLLIGGTADPFWDGSVATSVSPHVVEVADANHGMLVPGGLAASAAVLGQVITAVEQFLDQLWP